MQNPIKKTSWYAVYLIMLFGFQPSKMVHDFANIPQYVYRVIGQYDIVKEIILVQYNNIIKYYIHTYMYIYIYVSYNAISYHSVLQ